MTVLCSDISKWNKNNNEIDCLNLPGLPVALYKKICEWSFVLQKSHTYLYFIMQGVCFLAKLINKPVFWLKAKALISKYTRCNLWQILG
jgi:hypothetical protein